MSCLPPSVSPPDTADELKGMVDEFLCIEIPEAFYAVGAHYEDFTQVSDEALPLNPGIAELVIRSRSRVIYGRLSPPHQT